MEQPTYGITDIGTWLSSVEDIIFRFVVKRDVFTPYEQDKKFIDESIYENGGHWEFCKITKVIEIPNDVLLEMYLLYPDDECFVPYNRCRYVKLSQIDLEQFEEDNDGKEIVDHE